MIEIKHNQALSTQARDRQKFLLANPFLVDPPFLLGMFWENKLYSQLVLPEVDQYVLLSKSVQIMNLTFAFAIYLRF